MTLSEAQTHIGARVICTAANGVELHGEIQHVGPEFVFVRYDRDRHFIPRPTAMHLLTLET